MSCYWSQLSLNFSTPWFFKPLYNSWIKSLFHSRLLVKILPPIAWASRFCKPVFVNFPRRFKKSGLHCISYVICNFWINAKSFQSGNFVYMTNKQIKCKLFVSMKIDKVIERKVSRTDLDFLDSLWVRYDKVTLNWNCNFWCLDLTLCKIKIFFSWVCTRSVLRAIRPKIRFIMHSFYPQRLQLNVKV